jgi:hypothetical protein
MAFGSRRSLRHERIVRSDSRGRRSPANEQASLEQSVRTLHAYLNAWFDAPWLITIADNAGMDLSLEVATQLTDDLDRIAVLHLDEKGRGRAIMHAWLESTANVVAYVDTTLLKLTAFSHKWVATTRAA